MLETSQLYTGSCVHIEHIPSVLADNREMPPRMASMSPYRASLCLTTLGWSERELARRIGRHQTEVRRWMLGTATIDPNVAEWLSELEQFFRNHPAPRLRPLLRTPTGKQQHNQHGHQRADQAQNTQSTIA